MTFHHFDFYCASCTAKLSTGYKDLLSAGNSVNQHNKAIYYPREESGTRLCLHLTFPNWIKGSLFLRRVANASQRTCTASARAALYSQICWCSMHVYGGACICVGGHLMHGKGRKTISIPLAYCSQETTCKDVGCSHPAFHFECVLSPSE